MSVFTKEWTEKIRARYERQPGYQRPRIYYFALSDTYQDMRNEIEYWVAGLPSTAQSKLTPRLQAEEHFEHTYHELAVGHMLSQLGYQPEYEKTICGVTPDWYVPSREKVPAFILEIFTANLSVPQASKWQMIDDLLGRLRTIPIGVGLQIEATQARITLDPQHNSRLCEEVQKWLVGRSPSIGERLGLDGIAFTVIASGPQFPHVCTMGPAFCFSANEPGLRAKIHAKVKHYKKIADQRELALAVSVVASPDTVLDIRSFEGALLDQPAFQAQIDDSGSISIGKTPTHWTKGLLSLSPALSAAIWMWRTSSGEWRLFPFYNPKAKQPLPENTFEGGRNFGNASHVSSRSSLE